MILSTFFKKKSTVETFGYVLIGFGLYLGMSIVTFSLGENGLASDSIRNLGGPLGIHMARVMLGIFGIASLLYALGFVILGLVLVLGLIVWPKPRRFVAFFILTIVVACWAHLKPPLGDTFELSKGAGGVIGYWGGTALLKTVGYGGGMIALSILALITLVVTGNFTASRISLAVEYLAYFMRRSVSNSLTKKPIRSQKSSPGTPDLDDAPSEKDAKPSVEEPETVRANPLDLTSDIPRNEKPEPNIFQYSELSKKNKDDTEGIAEQLTRQLQEFKVEGKVTNITDGPVVTTYEYEPAAGTKVSKIVSLGEDLARLLKAKSLRVIAPIPGKNTVGFEIPNRERRTIGFGNLVDHSSFQGKRTLPVAMGVDTFGKPIVEDLAEMPHLLIAGSTGSGKSVFLNSLIASLVCKRTAKEMRLVMIDPKMVEFAAYNDLPHMACKVVTDVNEQAKEVLQDLIEEMEERYRLFRAVGAKNLAGFNKIIRSKRKIKFPKYHGKWQAMPSVVAIIEEFADFILTLGKEAEIQITRLAQKARAAGIHLVIATQRPSANVVTGLIKANFPTRVAFRVLSGIDSRTILDQQGAETLLGKGDMLYLSASGIQRIHAAILDENEISKMVKICRNGSR